MENIVTEIWKAASIPLMFNHLNCNPSKWLKVSDYNCDIFDHICQGQSSTYASNSTNPSYLFLSIWEYPEYDSENIISGESYDFKLFEGNSERDHMKPYKDYIQYES